MEKLNKENAKELDELLKKMIAQDVLEIHTIESIDQISRDYELANMLECDGYVKKVGESDVFQYRYSATRLGKRFYISGGYDRMLADKQAEGMYRERSSKAAVVTAVITVVIAFLALLALVLN
jgi:hypothetical protein